MSNLVEGLIEKGLTISTVESMTGGAIAAYIVTHSNASKTLKESLVTYSIESKIKTLGVSKHVIKSQGVVSSKVAIEMARLYHKKTKTDIVISITGYAEGHEPNEAFIGVFYKGNIDVHHLKFGSGNSRLQNIQIAVQYVDEILQEILKN